MAGRIHALCGCTLTFHWRALPCQVDHHAAWTCHLESRSKVNKKVIRIASLRTKLLDDFTIDFYADSTDRRRADKGLSGRPLRRAR